jgi:hypothetical protein
MTRKKWVVLSGVLLIAGVVLVTRYLRAHPGYKPPPVAFSGESSAAKQTVVVPTLDTPMPKGKNVIWCGTIQLCWDGLKALPGLQLPNDTDAVRKINAAHMNQADLPPGEFYTAAGRLKDGIVQKIQTDMADRFPAVKPNLTPPDSEVIALAYAYLAARVKFETPYGDHEKGDYFIDSAGNKTHVSSFGFYLDDNSHDLNEKLSDQIKTLYCKVSESNPEIPSEFALDMDKTSQPSQLILACVEPKESMAATWSDLKQKVAQPLGSGEQAAWVVVPNLNFMIQHQFKEFENVPYLINAHQSIDFLLDKTGAAVSSESTVWARLAAKVGYSFEFTRPFLIVMRKRGAEEPYFVMWVDNAELLCKQNSK